MKNKFTIVVCVVAMLGAVLGLSTGIAGAQDYSSAPESAPAPEPIPVATESTGVLIEAENGFSSLVNGNTEGRRSRQATTINPLDGDLDAATAAAADGATELAYTGSETLLAYAGLGLIAAGAIAMGTRRRLVKVRN